MTNPWEEAQALNCLKDVLRGGAAFVGSNLHFNRGPSSTYDPGQITDRLDSWAFPTPCTWYFLKELPPQSRRPGDEHRKTGTPNRASAAGTKSF